MLNQASQVNANLALDGRGLDALRLQARRDPDQALKAVAQQFEAVFLQSLLKTMRDATPKDGMMDSEQTRMYTSMLDQQLAQSLSGKGIGLADAMFRQLTRNRAAAAATDAPVEPLTPAVPVPVRAAATKTTTPATANVLPVATEPATADSSQSFLNQMKGHAQQAGLASGIPARFLLGQAALESGWGKHEIRAADGTRSHNLFGIKAGRNWQGATVDVTTTEYVNGSARKMTQKFRAYGSYAEAFQNYASMMQADPRYASVVRQTDGAGFAQGLQKAGYATDPAYANKLTQVLNGSRLRRTVVV